MSLSFSLSFENLEKELEHLCSDGVDSSYAVAPEDLERELKQLCSSVPVADRAPQLSFSSSVSALTPKDFLSFFSALTQTPSEQFFFYYFSTKTAQPARKFSYRAFTVFPPAPSNSAVKNSAHALALQENVMQRSRKAHAPPSDSDSAFVLFLLFFFVYEFRL
jgi:hypothetical protein